MTPQKPRILCVDDDPMNLSLLKAMLVPREFEIVTASSGPEALEQIRQTAIDVVLLDVIMPDMDGFEVCRRIKSDERNRHIPVVMITSFDARENRIKGIESGAEDFISKPFDKMEVMARIDMLLKVKALNDQLRAMNEHLEELVELRTVALQEAHLKLFQQEKLASLGQLMASIAHEINSPIGYIGSNLDSLAKYAVKISDYIEYHRSLTEQYLPSEVRDALKLRWEKGKLSFVINDYQGLIAESEDGIKRMKTIIQDLKGFSRKDSEELLSVDINRNLQSVLTIVSHELKYVADMQLDFSDVPPVRGNAQKLGQVFLNLLVNAAQAISGRGTLTIRTRREGTMVCVSISDTGSGIPPEVLPHIFEPFYTTKEAGIGTGLGLSISYDIIQKHGGTIDVVSEVGKGTTFTVSIPVAV